MVMTTSSAFLFFIATWCFSGFFYSQTEDRLCEMVYEQNHAEVEKLLKAGIDPGMCSLGDLSALELAKQNHDDQMIGLLKKYSNWE